MTAYTGARRDSGSRRGDRGRPFRGNPGCGTGRPRHAGGDDPHRRFAPGSTVNVLVVDGRRGRARDRLALRALGAGRVCVEILAPSSTSSTGRSLSRAVRRRAGAPLGAWPTLPGARAPTSPRELAGFDEEGHTAHLGQGRRSATTPSCRLRRQAGALGARASDVRGPADVDALRFWWTRSRRGAPPTRVRRADGDRLAAPRFTSSRYRRRPSSSRGVAGRSPPAAEPAPLALRQRRRARP